MRKWSIEVNFTKNPAGSVLIKAGSTWVMCTAIIQDFQPAFLRSSNSKSGWISAEYSMLPSSTQQRFKRERSGAKGRTTEIERLISRSLRQAVDLNALEKRTIQIDCDVLQADGGTRTASITGGYVALAIALERSNLNIPCVPVAAISAGKVAEQICVDLNYEQDSSCSFDLNAVLVKDRGWVELQATGEGEHGYYQYDEFSQAVEQSEKCIQSLFELQHDAIAKARNT